MKPQISLYNRLVSLPRSGKQQLMYGMDALALPCLMLLAYVIRLESGFALPQDWWLLILAPLITIPVLMTARLYRMVIRFAGYQLAIAIFLGVTLSSVLLWLLTSVQGSAATPFGVFVIYGLLAALYLAGSRFLARWLLLSIADSQHMKSVVIYGAGGAGVQSLAALESSREYRPVALVDDDPYRRGEVLQGVPVIVREGLKKLLAKQEIHGVLLAMPSVSRSRRKEVVQFLESLQVRVKTIPALPDIISGKASIQEVRDVAIEELLGRDPVPPQQELLALPVQGKRVLITGAGGSIGSELCRQIAHLQPQKIVLMEVSEVALYAISQELLGYGLEVPVVSVLGSVTDRSLVSNLLASHDIQTVFHAAAYKHVPMVEHNVAVGAWNNVIGTQVMAEESERQGVERFILISTDKAVRPPNVMGATKRMAELVLQALAARGSKTIFTMVRFGNVLGSSGSVVPLFRKQIASGGPVTVTHPEVIRYFMTIPEASQLVIQAGAMARGGEVFVLDMGDPVRIYDLACSMIYLMGMSVRNEENPEGDIEVRFTGLRPGEKLYEELLIGENSSGTDHPAIMRANEVFVEWAKLSSALLSLLDLIRDQNETDIRNLLAHYVAGFKGPNEQTVPVDAALRSGQHAQVIH